MEQLKEYSNITIANVDVTEISDETYNKIADSFLSILMRAAADGVFSDEAAQKKVRATKCLMK